MQNNSDSLEKKNYLNALFDIYGALLTQKQQDYFKAYYFLDYSLREIATDYQVSSNAVYDQIKTIEKTLEKYEAALLIYKTRLEKEAIIEKCDNNLIALEAALKDANSLEASEKLEKLKEEIKNLKNIENME